MNTSLFELFKIGIGPSSSHTVGPMRAARRFVQDLLGSQVKASSLRVDLYGSLALTGKGHATDRAVLLGLTGEAPDTVDLIRSEGYLEQIRSTREIKVFGTDVYSFHEAEDLRFHRDQMYPDPGQTTHPNGVRFSALDAGGEVVFSQVFYSVGGGFILSAEEYANAGGARQREVPHAFSSAAELVQMANDAGISIAEIVRANELALFGDEDIRYRIDRILAIRYTSQDPLTESVPPFAPAQDGGADSSPGPEQLAPEEAISAAILTLWQVMSDSIERGMATEGTLPGGLNVRRRAPGLAARLRRMEQAGPPRDPLAPLDSVTLVAMAVNEENAAGGRVVTAPTNGAAGVVPAIAHYFLHHASPELDERQKQDGLLRYFLTAAAIGILYKENASISGAEVGCQGEVGVACSMAAGGLVAALTPPLDAAAPPEARAAALAACNAAVEHAAEIAMEHNLGMTCDPIGGLVQIPCIERNGMGAVKAVNAARLALADPGAHKVSLDQVIETMYRTGMDMQSRYKETSLAGLALNIIEC